MWNVVRFLVFSRYMLFFRVLSASALSDFALSFLAGLLCQSERVLASHVGVTLFVVLSILCARLLPRPFHVVKASST